VCGLATKPSASACTGTNGVCNGAGVSSCVECVTATQCGNDVNRACTANVCGCTNGMIAQTGTSGASIVVRVVFWWWWWGGW
jgi:hypothetical protein